MKIPWDKILDTVIENVIKYVLPWTMDQAKKLLEDVYEWVEDWAKKMQKDYGTKPAPEAKMAMAVDMVRAVDSNIDPAEVRIMMEGTHLKKKTTA